MATGDWFDTNAPATTTATAPTGQYGGLGAAGSLAQPVDPWTGVAPTTPTYTGTPFTPTAAFAAPTGTDDPGYAFRQQAQQNAIESSAAAKGTLLTPATTKSLARYSQDLASQEYQNAFNRALTVNQTAYNRDLGENQLDYSRGLTANQTTNDRGLAAYNSAYTSFLNNQNATRNNQNDIYNRLFGLSNSGQQAATTSGNIDLSVGNVNAANTIANSNTTSQGLSAFEQWMALNGYGTPKGGGGGGIDFSEGQG